MAIKTKYRIKDSSGKYNVVYFQTSADQVLTNDDLQFVSKEEKQKIGKSETYVHNQIASSSVWEIEHNLGKFPSITIVDSAGTTVIGDIIYISENLVQIKFSSEFAGKALLN